MDENLELKNNLQILYEKYKNNKHMINRLSTHMKTILPKQLEYELNSYNQRIQKKDNLSKEQELFINEFFKKHSYYFLTSTNQYYLYNNKNYVIIKEDDIIHNLFSSISSDRVLMEWKQKTKSLVMKLIRERNLFKCIPESYTIQYIIKSLQSIMYLSKNEIKYFLCLLGDNILKKNISIKVYICNSNNKNLLNEIDQLSQKSIGINNITSNFVSKYHESHSYSQIRLLKLSKSIPIEIWGELLKNIGLDLLCVAVHYSNRFGNSELFLSNLSDTKILEYINYTKNKNMDDYTNDFINKYLILTNNNEDRMEWKNLHFLWKQFNKQYNYPNLIYSSKLKVKLEELYSYQKEDDCFLALKTSFEAGSNAFLRFWENNIRIIPSKEESFNNHFEIEELCDIFKDWLKQYEPNFFKTKIIDEEDILELINHYFPNVTIIDNRYIINIQNCLWDKIGEMNMFLDYLNNNDDLPDLNFILNEEEIYKEYYNYGKLHFNYIVSKQFFNNFYNYKKLVK
jgi:hypothetical protein